MELHLSDSMNSQTFKLFTKYKDQSRIGRDTKNIKYNGKRIQDRTKSNQKCATRLSCKKKCYKEKKTHRIL